LVLQPRPITTPAMRRRILLLSRCGGNLSPSDEALIPALRRSMRGGPVA